MPHHEAQLFRGSFQGFGIAPKQYLAGKQYSHNPMQVTRHPSPACGRITWHDSLVHLQSENYTTMHILQNLCLDVIRDCFGLGCTRPNPHKSGSSANRQSRNITVSFNH
jgi:hypothetical protein